MSISPPEIPFIFLRCQTQFSIEKARTMGTRGVHKQRFERLISQDCLKGQSYYILFNWLVRNSSHIVECEARSTGSVLLICTAIVCKVMEHVLRGKVQSISTLVE